MQLSRSDIDKRKDDDLLINTPSLFLPPDIRVSHMFCTDCQASDCPDISTKIIHIGKFFSIFVARHGFKLRCRWFAYKHTASPILAPCVHRQLMFCTHSVSHCIHTVYQDTLYLNCLLSSTLCDAGSGSTHGQITAGWGERLKVDQW